jgi:pimeloyl-ACP methyl ester carboxylesterase
MSIIGPGVAMWNLGKHRVHYVDYMETILGYTRRLQTGISAGFRVELAPQRRGPMLLKVRQFLGRASSLLPLPGIALTLLVSGCVFSQLDDDLAKLEDVTHLFTGTVSTDVLQFHSTVVVALEDRDAESIKSFRMMAGAGVFEIRAAKTPLYFFAFADLNKDLRFQADEPYGWAAQAEAISPTGDATTDIDILIGTADQRPIPEELLEEPLEYHLNNYANTHIGTVSSLEDPLFSNMQGRKGLWQPFAFWEDGGTGLHFLQPFDPKKTPVLFVHGINGSPRDFRSMIEQLDQSRFQAWFVSYPSGLRLSWLARGLFQFLEVLHRQYEFKELHVVAHSMGGLVSRGSLNLCVQTRRCQYLRSYTTLSTPWNGVASAESGVKYAPSIVPVWRDLGPDSDYVRTLFDTPLPRGVPHHLLFGFHQDGYSTQSSDGVIELSSQLRAAAQEQALTVRGFDEGHVSILQSEQVINSVNALLLQSTARRIR